MSDFLTTRNFLLSPGEAQATDPVVMRHGICECVGAAVVEVWRVLPQRPLPELYCVVKIEPTKSRHFRRSLRAHPSLGEGRVLAHWTFS